MPKIKTENLPGMLRQLSQTTGFRTIARGADRIVELEHQLARAEAVIEQVRQNVKRNPLGEPSEFADFSEGMEHGDDIRKESVRAILATYPTSAALNETLARVLEYAANEEADWTSVAWRSEEAETVVKLRKALKRRAAEYRNTKEARNE